MAEKFYDDLLKDVRAALAKHPGDCEDDDVVDAAVAALADQPLQAMFGALREAAGEPALVRALCNAAQANIDFRSEDIASIASVFGYRPAPGLARHG